MTIPLGKWRRLQQTASPQGTFTVLAIDHRGPVRRALEEETGAPAPDEALSALKEDVVRALGGASSAVLLDAVTGAGSCLTGGALDGQTGLIVGLDTGSTGDPRIRETAMLEGWSVEKTARMGAAGVKLLIYYHPGAPEASEREAVVKRVGEECARYEIPFFLEPLSFDLNDPAKSPRSPERRVVVVETARRLVPLGVDVLKAEFPVDVNAEPDEEVWRAACGELSAASAVPWVLLSGGVPFETFLRQTQVACEAGASGVMVGRAVWSEAVTVDTEARRGFLTTVASERMGRLRELCDARGRRFTELHERPRSDSGWYRRYDPA